MLAGVSLDGGVLTIDANDWGDNRVSVLDVGQDYLVLFNGDRHYVREGLIDSIRYNGGNGRDDFGISERIYKDAVVFGNGGDDVFRTSQGNDKVYGGSGWDRAELRNGYDGAYGVEQADGRDYSLPDDGTGGGGGGGGGGGTQRAYQNDPHDLPGRVQFEHFDEGGPGVAYNDSTSQRHGNSQLRPNDQVDIDLWPVKNVGWANSGEWLEYTVDVGSSGTFGVYANAATGINGAKVTVSNPGGSSVTTTLPNQGWGTYREHKVGDLYLPAGKHTLKVTFNNSSGAGTGRFDYLEFRRNGSNPTPQPPTTPQPPSNPQPPSGSVTPVAKIKSTTSSNIMAGMSYHAHGLDSTLKAGKATTARYEWDFGDPNGKQNKVIGFNAAHLYDSPGTYTVKLKVYNETGASDTTTKTVTVKADTRSRIHVAPWGSDNNSGSSSGSPVRTLGRAMQRLDQVGNNTAILLARGQTYDTNKLLEIQRDNVVIGAYGSGSKPTIMWTNPRDHWNNKNIVWQTFNKTGLTIRDIAFDTPHDNDGSGHGLPAAISPGGENLTVYNVTFRDVGDAILGSAEPTGVLVLENEVPSDGDLRRYFTWMQGSDWTVLGNDVPNSTREHIVRLHGADRVNIGRNDFGNIDRRDRGDQYDTAKGVLNIQRGEYAYAWGNDIEGVSGVGPLGDGDGLNHTWARFKHSVFEANNVRGGYIIEHGTEDAHIRSNIIREDNGSPIKIEGYNSSYNRTVKDVHIVNNTVINYGDKGQFARAWSGTQDVSLANNLYVAPNLYAGFHSTSILQINANNLNGFDTIENNVWADPDYLPWADGILWLGTGSGNSGFIHQGEWLAQSRVHNDRFSDTSINSQYRPNGGVAATAGRTYDGVFTDFHGNWRDPNGSRAVGAVEA